MTKKEPAIWVGCNLCQLSIKDKDARMCYTCKAIVCPCCLRNHVMRREHAIYQNLPTTIKGKTK